MGWVFYDGRYSPGKHGDIEMSAYDLISLTELIDLFEFNIKQYKGRHYGEAKTRVDFIDKFFKVFGSTGNRWHHKIHLACLEIPNIVGV